jgi:hypothetical protein
VIFISEGSLMRQKKSKKLIRIIGAQMANRTSNTDTNLRLQCQGRVTCSQSKLGIATSSRAMT